MKHAHSLQKNIGVILAIGVLTLVCLLFFAETALAVGVEFRPLTSIPGATDNPSFGDYINALFQLGLAIAALAAVVMIAIGGIQYMTTDSISQKGDAKERIWMAILGLLLALATWLILNTINPQLTSLGLLGGGNDQAVVPVNPGTAEPGFEGLDFGATGAPF